MEPIQNRFFNALLTLPTVFFVGEVNKNNRMFSYYIANAQQAPNSYAVHGRIIISHNYCSPISSVALYREDGVFLGNLTGAARSQAIQIAKDQFNMQAIVKPEIVLYMENAVEAIEQTVAGSVSIINK